MLVVLTLLAGLAAGGLGALLGLGGGVILVPLLNVFMGQSFEVARGVSLVGVLATSSAVAASTASRRLLNPRLAILLLVFSVGGATFGAALLDDLPPEWFPRIFGGTALVIAVLMLARLGRRNVVRGEAVDTGVLGGRFVDDDTGDDVAYRVRRLPLAFTASSAAGVLASFVGVGGGILIVPALNSVCGVPVRVAAATSAFMIGITAVPGTLAAWHSGYLGGFELAAAASIGALAGYRLGLKVSAQAPVQSLKVLMAALLLLVAVEYLW